MRQIPERGGGKAWSPAHLRAAQLRARGKDWPSVAEALGRAHVTVRKYQTLDGFPVLVRYFQRELFEAETERLFHEGSLEAVEALRQQFMASKEEVEELEELIAAGAVKPWIRPALFSKSKAATYAADKFLDAMGFKRYQQRLAELRAEMEIQGAPGTTLRHEGGSEPVRVSHDEPFSVQEAAAIFATLQAAGVTAEPDGGEDEDEGTDS